MIPKNLTSNQKINANKIVTVKFADATYTLKKFEYSRNILTLSFIFNNTEKNITVPYENNYSLNAFNINGYINKVKIKMPSLTQPMHA